LLERPFENFFSDTPTIVSPLAPKIERIYEGDGDRWRAREDSIKKTEIESNMNCATNERKAEEKLAERKKKFIDTKY